MKYLLTFIHIFNKINLKVVCFYLIIERKCIL